MYRKLLPLIHSFIMVRQGPLNRAYMGRLLSVDEQSIDIETFHIDGTRAEIWTVSLQTITEVLTKSKQLDVLALKVKWAKSEQPSAHASLSDGSSTLSETQHHH